LFSISELFHFLPSTLTSSDSALVRKDPYSTRECVDSLIDLVDVPRSASEPNKGDSEKKERIRLCLKGVGSKMTLRQSRMNKRTINVKTVFPLFHSKPKITPLGVCPCLEQFPTSPVGPVKM
jgi:hypothetical protein